MMLNDNLPADAQILPFYLADGSDDVALIRGRIASVGHAANTILARHDYPPLVATLQAEALALAACLSSTLKFDGVFTLQAKGDGLVRTLFADITEAGHLRGYAAMEDNPTGFQAAALAHDPAGSVCLGPLMGGGYIAFTVDDGSTNGRYQGIVELDERHLSDAAMRWYENSEQLDTIVVCAAENGPDGWQAVALMLQRIAADGGKDDGNSMPKTNDQARAASDDAWHTAKTLLGSITRDELLDPALSPEDIIFRLFNSMAPHSAPSRPVLDQCRCNVEKIESMLQQLAPDDIDDMADQDGNLTVTCEFCKTHRAYHKDAIPRP
ncbi:Hsp33 family molecular chaperone HslO [Alphaproteobacteria bacterium]|jgi:molecular chaperone Hsp33|nr:Hsp33 family molecular chaperone HslO [Alphaproteobacteria bacterium]